MRCVWRSGRILSMRAIDGEIMKARFFVSAALLVLGAGMAASTASAMPASCQGDFGKHTSDREAAVERINSFNKKRPTAAQACSAFSNLTGIEARMIKWMTENKEWCQLPDSAIEQLTQAREQTMKVRGQICTAAKKEAQMRASGGAAGGPPPPGSGVRLPSGAL